MENSPRALLLVGRLPRNLQLLAQFLVKEGYTILTAINYEEFDDLLTQHYAIAGSLIDIAGFDAEIWTRCEHLCAAKIPFLIFSPRHNALIQQTSLFYGASGVMVKPLVVKELIGVIQNIFKD